MLVEPGHPEISVRRQCELLGISRSGLYYRPAGETAENLRLMRLIDEQYTKRPFFGSRRMTVWLGEQGYGVNRKRVGRLMEQMGIAAVYPKPNLSRPAEGHKVFPYLLRDMEVDRVNQVWSTDITYIRMGRGFPLSGGRHGLVQPLRSELGRVGDHGAGFLSGGAVPRFPLRTA